MIDFITFIEKDNYLESGYFISNNGEVSLSDYQREIIDRSKVSFKDLNSFLLKINKKSRRCFKIIDEQDEEIIELLDRYFRDNIVPKKSYSNSISRITKQIQGRIKKKICVYP